MIKTDEHCSRSFYVGCWGNIISNLKNCELWRTRVSRHTHGARGARMLHVLCSKFVVATTLGSSTRIGGAWAIPIGCIVWWVAGTSNNWSRVSYSCLWAFDLRNRNFWEEHYSLTSSKTFLCAAKGDSQLTKVQSKHPMGYLDHTLPVRLGDQPERGGTKTVRPADWIRGKQSLQSVRMAAVIAEDPINQHVVVETIGTRDLQH